jgi:hypothetical protein
VTGLRQRLAAAATVALALSACVMVPRTVQRHDPACGIVARQMTLQAVQIASISGCSNQGCATFVAIAAVTGLASTVISGSIVLVGNVVYWLERRGQCGDPPVTAPAPATTSPAPAAFLPGAGDSSPPG